MAAEIHTGTRFCTWKIVLPTATCPLVSTFASTLNYVHHSCRGWRIQTYYWSIMMSGRFKLPTIIDRRRGWLSRPFSKSLLRNVLVEYAVLVSQLLVDNSPPQLRGWSTRITETRSLWCILWTCIVGRRIVPTGHILLVIGPGALTIPKH